MYSTVAKLMCVFCRINQERMAKLCEVFRDIQLDSPPLDGLLSSIIKYMACAASGLDAIAAPIMCHWICPYLACPRH